MASETTESSGVQQLIDRLHKEGIDKAETEANDLLVTARKHAMETLDQAKKEADEIVLEATREAERLRSGGEDAIRLAVRDASLSLTEELRHDFVRKLRLLVGSTLQDTEFLKLLILQIAGDAVTSEPGTELKISLLNDGSMNQEEEGVPSSDEALDEFVKSLGGAAMRDGLSFEIAGNEVPGVRVQIVKDELEIDLTTETLTHFLHKHLSPRFRAILETA